MVCEVQVQHDRFCAGKLGDAMAAMCAILL